MTKDEMSKIIAKALADYSWHEYRHNGSLPDYIANALIDPQLSFIANERPFEIQFIRENERLVIKENERLQRALKDKAVKLDVANDVIEKLQLEIVQLRDRLNEARAATPHHYCPSTLHMGDCSICGDTQDAPQHDIAGWKQRAEAAEAIIAGVKKVLL